MNQELIQVNIKEKKSIKEALLKFKSQMNEIYKTGELINKVSGFISSDNKLFQNSDLLDPQQIKKISTFENINDPGYEQMEDLSQLSYDQLNRKDVYLKYSHMLVFQHALKYEDLKKFIVDFCEDLIEYSLKINSSNELFFASNAYFGPYILVLLIEKYPEYAYMLGEFITKDSDYYQIKDYCSPYITYLFKEYGYEDFILDIFANCRFNELCIAMSENYIESSSYRPNFLKCFLRDKQKYNFYKKSLLNSLKRRPVNPEEINIVSMLENDYEILEEDYLDHTTDEFDYNKAKQDGFEEDFEDLKLNGKNIFEELKKLQDEMFDIVKDVALKDLYYYPDPIFNDTITLADIKDDPFYQEYDEVNEYKTNKEFFLKGFDNGKEIFEYIEYNKHSKILDEIKPLNIRKLAFEKKLYIYKRFEYFGSGGLQFSNSLEQDATLEDILEKFLVTYQNPESFFIDDDGEDEQNQKCLRCIDILVRLLGKKELTMEELKIITHDFKLCSKKEARKRYSIKKLNNNEITQRICQILNDPFSESFGKAQLDEVHEYYLKSPELFENLFHDIIIRAYQDTDKDLLAVVPKLNQKEFAKGSHLISSAYILYKESNSLIKNNGLKSIWDFYSNNIFKSFYRELSESDIINNSKEKESIIEKIKEYIDSQKSEEPNSFFTKFMKSSKNEELVPDKKKISKEQALSFIKKLLHEDEKDANDKNQHSPLFASDDIGMILASMLYTAKAAPKPLQKQLIALYQLILELYPSKTLLISFYEFSAYGDFLTETSAEEVEWFCDFLTDLGFDEKYCFLFKILIIQKINKYKPDVEQFDNESGLKTLYKTLITIYRNKDNIDLDEPAIIVRREKQISEAITKSVELLGREYKYKFLFFVYQDFDNKKFLKIIKEKLETEIADFIELNIQTPNSDKKSSLTELFSNYIFSDVSLNQINQKLMPEFADRKKLFGIDELNNIIVNSGDEIIIKFIKFICEIKKIKNLDSFYNSFTAGKTYNEEEALQKLNQIIKKAGFESELLYDFYLIKFKKENDNDNKGFEHNIFAQLLVSDFENLKEYENLHKKKAYRLFIKEKESHTDKNISINFNRPDSVRQGLQKLKLSLQKYYNGEYSFETDEVNILDNEKLIRKSDFLKYFTCQNIFADGYKIEVEEFEDMNIHYSILSQVYLLEKALESGYENEIIEICKNLLSHVKKEDNFHEIWYSDVTYFGFHLIFTLSYNNPKYSYMMSEYFTSDWDDQSITLHNYFYMLYEKYGINKDLLNAISYLSYGENLYESYGFLNPTISHELDETGKFIYKEKRRFFNKLKKDNNLYKTLKSYILKNADKYNQDFYDYENYHVIEKYMAALGGVSFYDDENFNKLKKEIIHGKTIQEEIDFLIEKIDKLFN